MDKMDKKLQNLLVGKKVRRIDPQGHTGEHTVIECFWDENDALHCLDDEGFWTPASKLELVMDDIEEDIEVDYLNAIESKAMARAVSNLLVVAAALNQDCIYKDNPRENILTRIAEARGDLDQLENLLKGM